ncbi:MAG: CheR family methyltransferase [Pseudomonadota bacterium]
MGAEAQRQVTLTDAEFLRFQRWLQSTAGICLSPAKKALVCGRLGKRLRQLQLGSYGDYFNLITGGGDPRELQLALDLLTTNETYFFREPKHFEYLRDRVLPSRRLGVPLRVWSAACSSGEEPYSIAMLLADRLGEAPWEIVASDISQRMLERCRSGHYPLERARHVPEAYLKSFCLKGMGRQEGTLLVDRRMQGRIDFRQINLNEPLPSLGEFDVVFLRNVMIYFDLETKRKIMRRVMATIRPGGHLMIGHSESLNGVCDELRPVLPSIYRKE